MDYHIPEVKVHDIATGVMEKQELIHLLSNELADDMFRDMASHVAATWDSVQRKTTEYNLVGIKKFVSEKAQLPKGAKLELRGYELLLKTPLPLLIRFGQGYFWIGRRVLTVCYKEEILAWFPYLIDRVLPSAITQWREKKASAEKELIIQQRLEALNEMYREANK